jgi:hypothetical protein
VLVVVVPVVVVVVGGLVVVVVGHVESVNRFPPGTQGLVRASHIEFPVSVGSTQPQVFGQL